MFNFVLCKYSAYYKYFHFKIVFIFIFFTYFCIIGFNIYFYYTNIILISFLF